MIVPLKNYTVGFLFSLPITLIFFSIAIAQSSYQPLPRQNILIENATILIGNGERIENGSIYLENGKIIALGHNLDISSDVTIINAKGKWVTPGLIDVHSHLGSYPTPDVASLKDTNETYTYNTAGVRMEDSAITQDAGFHLALAGGVTTLQILPGSHNVFGGLGVVIKNISARTIQEMKFPGAPYSLKMACGENPKMSRKSKRPITRMGVAYAMREEWIKATDYANEWLHYEKISAKGEDIPSPKRNLAYENLRGVLNGDILVQIHCYRAEEMAVMIAISKEFDYHITAFHHASEAYKIADILTANEICTVLFSDWWGFKMEAYDAIPEAMAFIHDAGGCPVIHSDSTLTGQYLNQKIAAALAAGKHAGLNINRAEAISWATLNAAKVLGLDEQTGSLEPGKNADLVIWSGDPFSVYTKAEKVLIDGAIAFDRFDKNRQPISDFELGQNLNREEK
ncbi:MAG: amidohydrolase [Alphaproteobacteria bacterium]|nr:MAG: amidohydrolase [Alphaproteobacteria bacterium]